jgi:hypothetical protein
MTLDIDRQEAFAADGTSANGHQEQVDRSREISNATMSR